MSILYGSEKEALINILIYYKILQKSPFYITQIFHRSSFLLSFERSCAMLGYSWAFQPWVLPLHLPFDEASSIKNIYQIHQYLYSDYSFFFHSNKSVYIPTIHVTDTLNHRGIRQYCPYCDSLNMLTDMNMKFLILITDAIIRSTIQLSESEATSIIDDLQTILYSIDK
uniref:Uncharacterized protein n=1 Tax=Heterorhabditis bacteriophora TaxID=37862 RepID=A0A1I7X6N5_HETBA